MIFADLQIAIHLRSIRNLDQYATGRFMLRTHIYHLDETTPVYATPINIMEGAPPVGTTNHPQTYQHFYLTELFPLKIAFDFQFNEICLFKTSIDINSTPLAPFHLITELLQVENESSSIIDTYHGVLSSPQSSDSLVIDFHGAVAAQARGTVHACVYRYHFRDRGHQGITLQGLCEEIGVSKAEEIIEYLLEESKQAEHSVAINMSSVTKAPAPIMAREDERETQESESVKYERKKIFDSPVRKSKVQMSRRVVEMERVLHRHAQNVYEIWTALLKGIFLKEGEQFQRRKEEEYMGRLKSKNGESISRFAGVKDVDEFQHEEEQRRELANKQRKMQPQQQFFRDFTVYNQGFFTQVRPFFFQEMCPFIEEKPLPKLFVVLVHGLGACRYDMERLRSELRRYYDERLILYVSCANEGHTQDHIDTLGERLALQVSNELSRWPRPPMISMIGHSLGGLIIRSALPRLSKYKEYFHSLVTLSTPHIGFAYSTSKLVDAGLWVLSNMNKCDSLLELTMQDGSKPELCYLYRLSQQSGLEWFKKVVFVGSRQDQYAPYYSARVQKHRDSQYDAREGLVKGVRYCEMINNILNRVQGKIIRMDVHFCIPQNFDNMIGRAAHIRLIADPELVRAIALAADHLIF